MREICVPESDGDKPRRSLTTSGEDGFVRMCPHLLTGRSGSQTDVQIGDLVLVVEDNVPCGRWNLGRVVKTFPGNDSLIHTVEVQTKQGTFMLVVKLCLLEEAECID